MINPNLTQIGSVDPHLKLHRKFQIYSANNNNMMIIIIIIKNPSKLENRIWDRMTDCHAIKTINHFRFHRFPFFTECQCPYDCVRNLDQCLVAGACRICKTPNYGKRG